MLRLGDTPLLSQLDNTLAKLFPCGEKLSSDSCLWCSNSFIMLIGKAFSLIRHCINLSALQCSLIM